MNTSFESIAELEFRDGSLVSRSAHSAERTWWRPADLAQARLECEPSVPSAHIRDGADALSFAFRVVPFAARPLPTPQFGDSVTPAARLAFALFLGLDGAGDDFWVARGELDDFLLFGRRFGDDWRIGAFAARATTLTVRFEDFWWRIPQERRALRYGLSALRDPQAKDAPETAASGIVREPVPDLAPDARVCVDLADNGGFLLEFNAQDGMA